jgi:hypothetical protein
MNCRAKETSTIPLRDNIRITTKNTPKHTTNCATKICLDRFINPIHLFAKQSE